MDKWISSFIVGSILSLFLPKVPVLFFLILWCLIVALAFLYPLLKYIHIALLGILWMNSAEYIYQNPASEINHTVLLSKQVLLFDGKVTSIPRRDQNKQYFTFEITHVNHKLLTTSVLARLSWKEAKQPVYQGQTWRLNARVKPAHGYGNVGGFNYRTWLRSRHVLATGYVVNQSNKISQPNLLLDAKTTLRQKLYIQADAMLAEKPLGGVIKALSFGERGDISDHQKRVLQITSTGHLIAISGLHLGLIATGGFFTLTLFFRTLPLRRLPAGIQKRLVTINNRYLVIFCSISITCFYAYVSGFSLPTLRALLMVLLYWLLRLGGMTIAWRSMLLMVVLLVIIVWPFSLMSLSFWLSFYAVFIISLISWRFLVTIQTDAKVMNWIKSFFKLQLILSIALLPLTLLINYEFSGLSAVANFIAVPLMSVTAIPLCLLATLALFIHPEVSDFLYQCAYFFVEMLWMFLTYLSEQSWAIIPLGGTSIIFLSIVVFYSLARLFYGLSLRWFDGAIVCVLISFFMYRNSINEKIWHVNVLDVGQGLSIIIEKNQQVLLYDTGASYPSGFNLVDVVVIPYIKSRGIGDISEVIISHSDNDHAGGITRLKKLQPSLSIRGNDSYLKAQNFCLKGDSFIWQGLDFHVLWPLSSDKGRKNEDSCVIKVTDGKHALLLTGDIPAQVEKRLIASDANIQADVLIVPHHGSKSSSSEAFIHAVSPKMAVFSAGYLNRWDMPNTPVVLRYQDQGIRLFNTAEQGMIRFNISESDINATTYRDDLWPFWFAH